MDTAVIFHIYIPWGMNPFFTTKFKVIVKYQGQFSKKWLLGGHSGVSQTHLVPVDSVT